MPQAILIHEDTRETITAKLPFDPTDIFDTDDYNFTEYGAVDSYLVIDGSVEEGNFVANVFISMDFKKNWNYDRHDIQVKFVEITNP